VDYTPEIAGLYDVSGGERRAIPNVALSSDGNRILVVRGDIEVPTPNFGYAEIYHYESNAWVRKAILHNAQNFGWGFAISGDGNTVALTAPNKTVPHDGFVYIYEYNAGSDTWSQTLSRSYSQWAESASLNYDGTTLAFVRTNNPSYRNEQDTASEYVHILRKINGLWNNVQSDVVITSPATLKYWHYYGKITRLSPDGSTLVVGAPGFPVDYYFLQAPNTDKLNAVYVYNRVNGTWNPTPQVLQPTEYASLQYSNNVFGNAIAVNQNGTTIAVGAQLEGNGKVYVFRKSGSTWTMTNTISSYGASTDFGVSINLNSTTSLLHVLARNGVAGVNPADLYKYNIAPQGVFTINGEITMNGNIGIGTENALEQLHVGSNVLMQGMMYLMDSTSTGDARLNIKDVNSNLVSFYSGNSNIGSITTNGAITSYNTTSDYRLKENIANVTGAVDKVMELNPKVYNYIGHPNETYCGFLAHELQQGVPYAVQGVKDQVDADGNPVYQTVDYSKVVPLLTAALQEVVQNIQTLNIEVSELKLYKPKP
jgi:hypothetical protein